MYSYPCRHLHLVHLFHYQLGSSWLYPLSNHEAFTRISIWRPARPLFIHSYYLAFLSHYKWDLLQREIFRYLRFAKITPIVFNLLYAYNILLFSKAISGDIDNVKQQLSSSYLASLSVFTSLDWSSLTSFARILKEVYPEPWRWRQFTKRKQLVSPYPSLGWEKI